MKANGSHLLCDKCISSLAFAEFVSNKIFFRSTHIWWNVQWYFFMFQGEMLHYALFQGMHRVFVPIRREGTNRSNDRLRRQTLKQNTRQNSAILNTHPSSIRHRFKNTNVPRNGHHDSAALPSRDKCRVPPFWRLLSILNVF